MPISLGQTADSQLVVMRVLPDGTLAVAGEVTLVDSTPARMPIQSSTTLGAEAVDLGTIEAGVSAAGWELVGDGEWSIGTWGGQLRTVASGEAYVVPSSTLAGWYAVSAGAVELVMTGAAAL